MISLSISLGCLLWMDNHTYYMRVITKNIRLSGSLFICAINHAKSELVIGVKLILIKVSCSA